MTELEPTYAAAQANLAPRKASATIPDSADHASRLEVAAYRVSQWLRSPRPYLMLVGFVLFLGFWYLAVEVWKLPRFSQMPGPTAVISEWLSPDPTYGLSIYSPEYYQHIWVSWRRVSIAFILATAMGVPLGLLLGWSQQLENREHVLLEPLRPIPPLAWVPVSYTHLTLPTKA